LEASETSTDPATSVSPAARVVEMFSSVLGLGRFAAIKKEPVYFPARSFILELNLVFSLNGLALNRETFIGFILALLYIATIDFRDFFAIKVHLAFSFQLTVVLLYR
jgi:hypothetical protein